MNDTYRDLVLQRIEDERARIKKIEKEIMRFKVLLQDPLVQEYLALKTEISREKRNFTKHDITSSAASYFKNNCECQHDIWFLESVEEKSDAQDAIYTYTCLECAEIKNPIVSEEARKSFESNNRTIDCGRSKEALETVRNRYFELLGTYTTSEAYVILRHEFMDPNINNKR